MKGNVKDILAANIAIQYMEIAGGASYKVVRAIGKLRTALSEEAKLANAEQLRLLDDCGGKPTDAGVIVFPDASSREKFEKAWDEVLNTEIEVNAERLDLSSLADNIIFHNSNADVVALSAFIDFGDD